MQEARIFLSGENWVVEVYFLWGMVRYQEPTLEAALKRVRHEAGGRVDLKVVPREEV
jgi:hypothetical protein